MNSIDKYASKYRKPATMKIKILKKSNPKSNGMNNEKVVIAMKNVSCLVIFSKLSLSSPRAVDEEAEDSHYEDENHGIRRGDWGIAHAQGGGCRYGYDDSDEREEEEEGVAVQCRPPLLFIPRYQPMTAKPAEKTIPRRNSPKMLVPRRMPKSVPIGFNANESIAPRRPSASPSAAASRDDLFAYPTRKPIREANPPRMRKNATSVTT